MTTSPYLQGNFGPVQEERTETKLKVNGELPRELNGQYLRIGPNPIAPTEPYHWFTGNGMVHGLQLRDGQALSYRNRYVRDDQLAEVKGWPEVSGPRHGVGGNTANTNIIRHAGKNFAIVEAGGLPVELDDDLETVARSDFGGTLEGGFTAHPKRDPQTGELHAVTYYWEWDHLKYVVVGTDGRVRHQVEVPVSGGPMVHDMGLSENFAVLFDLPCLFDPSVIEAGGSFPYVWHPENGARMGILPREGSASDVRWFDVDPCYVFHPLNTYEVGSDQVVMDAVRHDRIFAEDQNGITDGSPKLARWTFDLVGGSVKEEQLDDRLIEFPRHDERLVGKKHRFGYATCYDKTGAQDFPSLVKYDLQTGASTDWDPGEGRSTMEPVFVPRSETSAEDDGWIVSYVYDKATDRSEFVVLDAANFGDGPIATVELPTRIPYGFHRNWIPEGQ